jgi:hypothetical protein
LTDPSQFTARHRTGTANTDVTTSRDPSLLERRFQGVRGEQAVQRAGDYASRWS